MDERRWLKLCGVLFCVLAVSNFLKPLEMEAHQGFVFFGQRQRGKVRGARRVADADGLQKAATAFEGLDVSQHLEQPLGRRVDAHGPGRHHLAVKRSWQ
jgi:hypothetical protein